MDEHIAKLVRDLTTDLVRATGRAARAAQLQKELDRLRSDQDDVLLANVGLSKAYQRNLEELDRLREPKCSCDGDPIECSHEAARGQAEAGLESARIVIRSWKSAHEGAREELSALKAEADSMRALLKSLAKDLFEQQAAYWSSAREYEQGDPLCVAYSRMATRLQELYLKAQSGLPEK